MYKYENVANNIIRDIELEILRPGFKLFTDEQLMTRYQVSRVTARKAVEYLIDLKYIKAEGNKRLITNYAKPLTKSLNHFKALPYQISKLEITNVMTESIVEKANPFSDDIFKRNVGAYFKVDLWYQAHNAIIINTQSLIPAEIVSDTETDMYRKKEIQDLIENQIYALGHNADIEITVVDPRKVGFAHAIQGVSNAAFYQIKETVFNNNQKVILYNEHYASIKNVELILQTK